MASETLGFLANLSNSAAKLLVFRMLSGVDKTPVVEIMRICGLGSRTTYYAAKRELDGMGLGALYKNGTEIGTSDVSKTVPLEKSVSKTGLVGVQKMIHVPKTVPMGSTENGLLERGDKTWVELAEDTDALSGEGKREQAKLVVADAWADMFPNAPIHTNTVAQWLSIAKWVCADVVGSMVVAQDSNIPSERAAGWMRKTLPNLNWKGSATKQTTKTQSADVYDDPETIEKTYQWMIGKYGQHEADMWRAEELARIGA